MELFNGSQVIQFGNQFHTHYSYKQIQQTAYGYKPVVRRNKMAVKKNRQGAKYLMR